MNIQIKSYLSNKMKIKFKLNLEKHNIFDKSSPVLCEKFFNSNNENIIKSFASLFPNF